MSGIPPIGARADESGTGRRGLGARLRSPKTIAGLVIIALAAWFVLVNTSRTRIHFWVVWVSAQLWLVLAGTFLAGMLAGYLVRRRSRDRKPRA
ncbi:LapA family protein [Actinocrinis puniceicyclus]|uniref:LapA family protein n=1 Tax=Actinocrinis puniceicyclus TaxID=977794 RepID=A0A8J8BA56_9ACTN|nr:LapA family protein [Actinocrinis puniceicyclus]MBS2961733.1 LapA family protein [Actinocrinis puniceicyclus]